MQLFLLSIGFNIVGALALLSRSGAEKFSGIRDALSGVVPSLVIGLGSIAVGIIKLISPLRVAVVGDLLPALFGIAIGAGVLVDMYATRNPETEQSQQIQKAGGAYRTPLAIGAVVVAVVHFLFPMAVIL